MFDPGEIITIDESLVEFHGRVAFRQYIPTKAARYGIKIWQLVDRNSLYVYNSIIYDGKRNTEIPLGEQVFF
uniref:PiggyBac transposable element-derived protein domain-containing protein n=1 Tax=Acrobeloides nanus TaxID=290746 RepID=A0A914CTH7_9BILA